MNPNIKIPFMSQLIFINSKCQRGSIFDGLKQQETVLADIEIDIMLSLIGDVRAEMPAHNAMPVPIVLPIELVFQMGCDFLGGVHFL